MGKGPAEARMGYHWEWQVTKPPLELPEIKQGNILLKHVIPPFVSCILKLGTRTTTSNPWGNHETV